MCFSQVKWYVILIAQLDMLFGTASNLEGFFSKTSNSQLPSEAIQQVSLWHQRSLHRLSVSDEWSRLTRPSGVSNGRRTIWAVHARWKTDACSEKLLGSNDATEKRAMWLALASRDHHCIHCRFPEVPCFFDVPFHHPRSWDFPWNTPTILGYPYDYGNPQMFPAIQHFAGRYSDLESPDSIHRMLILCHSHFDTNWVLHCPLPWGVPNMIWRYPNSWMIYSGKSH